METSTESPLEGRTAVYRLYDDRNRLLYVGITNSPKARWLAHAGDKAWWPDVARRDVEWVGTRELAALMEIQAIRDENPKHNIRRPPSEAELKAAPRVKLYQEVAASLRRMILSGGLGAGARVPGENTLMGEHGISRTTARQALALLAQEGLTTTRHGAGIWVRHPDDRTVVIPVGRPALAAEIIKGALSTESLVVLIELLSE